MARDPSKKGVRKIPPEFIKLIETHYGKEVAKWYKTTTGTGKAEATRQRQGMSDIAGQTGAIHEGHFQGAKDFDGDMGGGPTTGRTMRPQIGVYNVAHAELPRITKRDMKRLGIPQYWVEDFYEAVLESEGKKVIGNLDVQGAFEMDRGASAEQAAYNSRTRADLRQQGVEIPGDRYTGVDRPAPITQLPDQQPLAPKFDASSIKQGTGIPRVSGESRVRVPDPIEITGGTARIFRRTASLLPAAGGLIGLNQMSAQAAEGKYMEAAATGIETVVGEVPIVGDAIVNEFQGRSAGAGSDIPSTAAQRQMVSDYEATPASKIVSNPMNELEWAAKNPVEALKNIRENDAVKATGGFLRNVGGSILFGF